MLKVVAVVDKVGTAIDRLAKGVIPYNGNLDYIVCDVHPKRPDPEQLSKFEQAAASADIIDFHYFRSAMALLERYPWLSEKKLILNHYNPYSITESNWDQFDKVTAPNETIRKDLIKIMHNPAERLQYIPLATDPTFWQFNFDWVPTKRVIMVANRIEAKKGILEVAIACGDLGLTFVLVGSISDPNYFHDILQTGNIEFHEKITDEELRDLYYKSAVHVCNSIDNFESGTMPILEAMQCGTPVLTRNVGHVPDLNNGENMVILESGNVLEIQEKLESMLSDTKALENQRQKAWNTAKNFNMERRAYSFQRLYRSVMPGEAVSIIVPVYDKPETIRACLNAIANQTYENIEVIVADDAEPVIGNRKLVADFAQTVSIPVRYINTFQPSGYGLARARNEAAIYATGDILVFCDQRQIMDENAVQEFVNNLTEKTWLNGNKGGGKTEFIENFSCIARTDFIEFGMFSERMDCYGGLSQETRNRARAQGIKTQYVESAKATPMGKSSNRNRKKQEIIRSKDRLWMMGL